MKKKCILGMFLFVSIALLSVSIIEVSASTVENNNVAQINNDLVVKDVLAFDLNQLDSETKKQMEVAEKIAHYFVYNADGSVKLEVDVSTLMNNGLSEQEASQIIQVAEEFERIPNRVRGFVGLHIHLGTKVRRMGAWSAGAYVGGYIGWYLKQFATSPHTAGVVALISGSVVWSVKTAIDRNLRRVSLGMNIPFVAMAFTVNTP